MANEKPASAAQKTIGQIAPKLAQLTYVGWPSAMSAITKLKEVL